MPRKARITVVDAPHYVYQRGVKGRVLFSTDKDYQMYLEILARNSQVYNTDVLGYCLLKDQVHLVVVPHKKAALSNMVARTHFDYTRYMNAKRKSSGALWYDRFHSCILDDSKLQQSIQFVDQMAAQKKLVRGAAQYKWSSAAAHVKGKDSYEVLDLKAWPPARLKKQWAKTISAKMEPELVRRFWPPLVRADHWEAMPSSTSSRRSSGVVFVLCRWVDRPKVSLPNGLHGVNRTDVRVGYIVQCAGA